MTRSLLLCLLSSILLACTPPARTALRPMPGIPDTAARFLLSRDSALAAFPVIPLASLGCSEANVGPQPDGARVFAWTAYLSFPDGDLAAIHGAAFDARFTLASGVALTATRLDSALRAVTMRVRESAGEPPMLVATIPTTRSRASFRDGRVTLTVWGDSAIALLTRTQAQQGSLIWCELDKVVAYRTVPLARRQ